MIHGDMEAAEKAAARMNQRLEEQRALAASLSETDEMRAINAGRLLDINENIGKDECS